MLRLLAPWSKGEWAGFRQTGVVVMVGWPLNFTTMSKHAAFYIDKGERVGEGAVSSVHRSRPCPFFYVLLAFEVILFRVVGKDGGGRARPKTVGARGVSFLANCRIMCLPALLLSISHFSNSV